VVTKDTIALDLRSKVGDHYYVHPASVYVTTSGQLEETNYVKRIIHVAAVQGEFTEGYHPVRNIQACVAKSLARANSEELKELDISSILLPLMGTGTARGRLEDHVEKLISEAISSLESFKDGSLKTVYFLAWTDKELKACRSLLDNSDRVSKV
jgi:O-acetyl-ADP-ribose deacetylase (regulator of RNase III)